MLRLVVFIDRLAKPHLVVPDEVEELLPDGVHGKELPLLFQGLAGAEIRLTTLLVHLKMI